MSVWASASTQCHRDTYRVPYLSTDRWYSDFLSGLSSLVMGLTNYGTLANGHRRKSHDDFDAWDDEVKNTPSYACMIMNIRKKLTSWNYAIRTVSYEWILSRARCKVHTHTWTPSLVAIKGTPLCTVCPLDFGVSRFGSCDSMFMTPAICWRIRFREFSEARKEFMYTTSCKPFVIFSWQ